MQHVLGGCACRQYTTAVEGYVRLAPTLSDLRADLLTALRRPALRAMLARETVDPSRLEALRPLSDSNMARASPFCAIDWGSDDEVWLHPAPAPACPPPTPRDLPASQGTCLCCTPPALHLPALRKAPATQGTCLSAPTPRTPREAPSRSAREAKALRVRRDRRLARFTVSLCAMLT